jgi:hypothetical protein
MVFQGILEPKWFRICWSDGSQSEHTTHVLQHLGKVSEDLAPPELMHAPSPVEIFAAITNHDSTVINWSILTPTDIQERLEQLMPGGHSYATAQIIHSTIPARARKSLNFQTDPAVLNSLLAVLDFRHARVVLDPYAANRAVSKGFRCGNTKLLLNDRHGGVELWHEPIEQYLYRHVAGCTGLGAVICIPPEPLADIILVTALHFVESVVCIYVPQQWVAAAGRPRFQFLHAHEQQGTVLTITSVSDSSHCWVCIFRNHDTLLRMLHDPANASLRWVLVNDY